MMAFKGFERGGRDGKREHRGSRADLHATRAPPPHGPDRARGWRDPYVDQQADVIIRGDASAVTWIKATGNFVVPFIVSNLGLLAGKRAERLSR
jgi:hypothetical protein